MNVYWLRYLAWLLVVVGIGLACGGARGQAPRLAEIFKEEPEDALVRRLEAVADELPEGIEVARSGRWDAKSGLLLIETTLTNRGKAAVDMGPVAIGHWATGTGDADAARYRELTYRNDPWHGSTYWAGPDWTRVGRNWHHPGTNTPSIRRFAAPRDGRATITGRIYKLDTNTGGGDGVRLAILHRGQTVWKAQIDGGDTEGVEPNVTLDLRAGDSIRFVVHKRGRIFYDTTHWDPVVNYVAGPTFRASEGFSTSKQGEHGWSYEMQTDPRGDSGLPQVYGFDRNLLLRKQTFDAGQPASSCGNDSLPMWVVADGPDRSGIAVALCYAEQSAWRLHAEFDSKGRLQLKISVGDEKARVRLPPGGSLPAAKLIVAAYRGSWPEGMTCLKGIVDRRQDDPRGAMLSKRLADEDLPELDLWAMVQAEWRREDGLVDAPADDDDLYTNAAAKHLKATRQLLDDLRAGQPGEFLADDAKELRRLEAAMDGAVLSRKRLYWGVRRLKRRIVLSNPLLNFDRLLLTKRVPTSYSHLVMQYFGWRARPGGGIFILARPGYSLACRDILDGRLEDGNVLEPRLSYDAKRIVFSLVKCPPEGLDPGRVDNRTDVGFYHVYEVNVDGTNLRQLTRGPYDDVMPTYLPDGRIVFCSTRRRGYARCFGSQFSGRWHVYTLHRIDVTGSDNADGGNLRTLSFHDTNEWFPAVANTGHILYSRWDYIDRDAVTHQNLWATRPDGTAAVTVWGNATASPHCTFQIRPIPGSSKIAFTASAHHSIAGGSIALVDPTVGYDGHDAITRITPEVPFPEAEGRNIREYYAAPWPLSEKYFLVAYSPTPLVWEPGANARNALGIYTLDVFGNRELIYRDPAIGSTNPCPLVPRPVPPVLPSVLPSPAPATGEMVLADVYEGLGSAAGSEDAVPRGSIKRLRIIQILPKTTVVANVPPIGLAHEENARAVLGSVPVEPDGSAYFTVPAGKPILFQALDEQDMAYQTMRSVTYVQPGERASCVGCHENRMTAPVGGTVSALHRPPSKIEPGRWGGRPFSFMEVVQPVLEKHCVNCHGGEKVEGKIDLAATPDRGFTKSYWSLCGGTNFWGAGTNENNAAKALVPRFGARNQVQVTPPGGVYGARGSRLLKLLRTGHEGAKLADDELARLALWIDCNAIFYGVYHRESQARQLRGEAVPMPEIQ